MGGLPIVLFFALTLAGLWWSLLNVEKTHRDPQHRRDRDFVRNNRF